MAQFNGLAENIETNVNKVTEIMDDCTHTEYPSAAAVRAVTNSLAERISALEALPHIIESGSSGIWRYRKWSDGGAECWIDGSQTFQVALAANQTGWDGLSGGTTSLTITLPLTFVTATVHFTPSGSERNIIVKSVNPEISNTDQCVILFYQANVSALTIRGSIHVMGRWQS